MGWTEGSADGVIDEDGSRRCDFAHNVQDGAYHQRWSASRFDNVSDETDGLMAKRSIGYEQGEIHLGFL